MVPLPFMNDSDCQMELLMPSVADERWTSKPEQFSSDEVDQNSVIEFSFTECVNDER